jgi:hypothetical protein
MLRWLWCFSMGREQAEVVERVVGMVGRVVVVWVLIGKARGAGLLVGLALQQVDVHSR